MNTRLVITLITSLIDELIIIAVVIWGLPHWGVHIPWWGTALLCVAFAAYAYWAFRLGSRILRKKPLAGFTDLIGMSGRAVDTLAPRGMVRINSELWEAKAEHGAIPAGHEVEVVSQDGMTLLVRPKEKRAD
jgi:membrane-bound ClpP family serine protease